MYIESVPHNQGNGTLMAKYIKNNYKNIVILASGYEDDKDKPLQFCNRY